MQDIATISEKVHQIEDVQTPDRAGVTQTTLRKHKRN